MKFKIMCGKGDAGVDYGKEVAEIKFDELVESNLRPFEVVPAGGGLKPMREFNPNAKEIHWMLLLAGG